MTKNFIKKVVLALGVAFFFYACSIEESIKPSEPENFANQVIPGKYIVVYNTNETGGTASSRLGDNPTLTKAYVRSLAVDVFNLRSERIDEVYSSTINGIAVNLTDSEVLRLRQDKRVLYIEQDRVITLAPPPGKGPPGGGDGGTDPAQETPWGITRVGGGANYTGSGVAWVIDTGIDSTHPDLNVDVSRGFSAFTKGKDVGTEDGNGHGTHVAGTIAAINNTIGVVGVAAGATVIPVKVLDSRGSGSYSGVIAGVDFVAANGNTGDVANMSLGGGPSASLDAAVVAASTKVKFSIAAGNESDDANNHSPARANGPNIYTISAMNSSDNWASFSNYGNPPVDYCAPGVSVKSTWKGGGYNTISGTSMAAPHAAGVLLLGTAKSSGTVNGDPDGNPDPIIHR